MRWRTVAVCALVGVAVAGTVTVLVVRSRRWSPHLLTLQGAVIRQNDDAQKQLPISGAVVTATHGSTSMSTESDASGYYKIDFPELIWPGQTIALSFRHPQYEPLDRDLQIQYRSTPKRLLIAALKPLPVPPQADPDSAHPAVAVSNIRIRYTENFQTEENIGSAVRTFQVVNQGNVPCRHQPPCSPDGNWKAASGSITLDAGASNEFRNVRASCIAGPCPFTRIDASGFSHGGRTVVATAVDWSDTATFLLEAEVFHTTIGSSGRHSYPLIFGRTLNFTLPPTQEGASIEAELDGAPMVFPLGPELYLSWATCDARTNRDGEQSTVYRCELKPGYRF